MTISAVILWLAVGLVLGVVFIALARVFGERRVFAVGLVVAAGLYVGLAVYGDASWTWLGIEVAGVGLYGALAVLGYRSSAWWLALGWALHPVWDVALHQLGGGSEFAPPWYPVQCISLDLLVAFYIAWRQWRRTFENASRPPLA